jgi:hypothetical protein
LPKAREEEALGYRFFNPPCAKIRLQNWRKQTVTWDFNNFHKTLTGTPEIGHKLPNLHF